MAGLCMGLSIAPVELIDDDNVATTRHLTHTDGVLDYYLHSPGGAVTVSGGGFGEQTIQALSMSGADQAYFNAMVRRLDNIIDLDFCQVGGALRRMWSSITTAKLSWVAAAT